MVGFLGCLVPVGNGILVKEQGRAWVKFWNAIERACLVAIWVFLFRKLRDGL